MLASLNEIDATARKAARGAGLPWGLAEEAGKAVRCLEARRLPGLAPLLTLLRATDGRNRQSLAPARRNGTWHSPHGMLCPVVSGAAMSDMLGLMHYGQEIRLQNVLSPVLVLGVLVAGARRKPIVIAWTGLRAGIGPAGIAVEEETGLAAAAAAADVTLHFGQASDGKFLRREIVGGVPVDERVWAALQSFVIRTYVPASQESRRRGAGAGLLDND